MNLTTRFEDLPDILTADETAEYLRLGRSSIYEAIRRKHIRSVRIGRRILIPKSALRPFVEATIQE
jgi:excisionase family DNA binding protein